MKLFRAKKEEEAVRREIAVKETAPFEGLTEAEAAARAAAGWANLPVEPPARTAGQIVRENLLTYFNLVFLVLALCLVAVKASILNLSFIVVVIINAVIGIVQELRSKKALDALHILTAPQCAVVREGKERRVEVSELVRDDIVIFTSGGQVCADAVVVDGACLVNEALVTGEADEIRKAPGDTLLSGSFLVSGMCRARLTAVGADSFVSRLTLDAKAQKKRQARGMMKALNDLVKWIGVGIIPMGVLLVVKEVHWLGRSIPAGVTSTVGALVGMIPEGVYLLTSLALVAGVLRLAQKKTMCREMDCIETLARVDTLCLDKTGTITEGTMQLDEILPLHDTPQESIETALAAMMQSLHDSNPTSDALREAFPDAPAWRAVAEVPFSSARKWSGVSFQTEGTYVLGAAEFVLKSAFEAVRPLVESYSDLGHRVLVLAHADAPFSGKELPLGLNPVALILLSDKIRPSAKRTLAYFADQGVTLKVISGDNAHTVSNIAEKAGLEHADRYIDATTLQTDAEIAAAAKEYTVFGRVTPQQKLQLVKALKQDGHTVAMTGDGVNDVLALKEADCSVAMASGSDAARTVSQLVLLDSDFASMPLVVKEGRRSINNLQRSASLFLVKTIFSTLIAVFFIFAPVTYPMEPIQLTLISFFTIGTPSFLLALGPNKERVHGHFIWNVLQNALPAALTMTLNLIMMTAIFQFVGFTGSEFSTLCVLMNGFTGLLMLLNVCRPLNSVRTVLFCAMAAGFTVATIFFQPLFGLVPVTASMLVVLIPMMFFAVFLMSMLSQLLRNFAARVSSGSKRRHTRR